jgi:uncharacterized protein
VTASDRRGPLEPREGGVRLFLKVTPKASRNAVQGVIAGGDGEPWRLKIAVTAAPEDGKANAAIIAVLARAWALPRSDMAIIAGKADRLKLLFIAGDPQDLMARLGPHLP